MKVTSIEFHPVGSSQPIVLSFRDPRRLNPFNVRGIVGLDADEIVPRYYGVSATKQKYYNMSIEKRQPVFQIELNPNYENDQSYSDLRDILYRMISASRTGVIEIQFKNGATIVAVLSGFLSKKENALFDKNPGVSLTFDCAEGLLKAPIRTEIDILTLDAASTVITDEVSTATHGFVFELGFINPVASLTITPPDDAWSFAVTPVGGFLSADVLHFSSEVNNKYLFIRRGVSDIYLADVITPGSIWPILFYGDNVFEFSTPTDLVWEAVAHYLTYWGV